MDKNEKLALIATMLDTLVSLPEGMGLTREAAKAEYDNIASLEDEAKIDESLQVIAGTLGMIETEIKKFEQKSKIAVAQDNEAREASEDSASLDNLFL